MKSQNKVGCFVAVPPAAITDHFVMSLGELQTACCWWQKQLRLQDWDIILKLVRERDVNGNLGQCSVNEPVKTARISIATHDDYDVMDWPNDMEHTLVHELLHVLFWGCNIDGSNYEGTVEEQGINILATTLITQARAAHGERQWSF